MWCQVDIEKFYQGSSISRKTTYMPGNNKTLGNEDSSSEYLSLPLHPEYVVGESFSILADFMFLFIPISHDL